MMNYFNNYFIQIHYWPNYFPLGLTISVWFDHISLLIKPLQCWLNWPICFWLQHFTFGLTISVLIWSFHYWLNYSTFYEEISILTEPFHFHFSFLNRVYWPFFFSRPDDSTQRRQLNSQLTELFYTFYYCMWYFNNFISAKTMSELHWLLTYWLHHST